MIEVMRGAKGILPVLAITAAFGAAPGRYEVSYGDSFLLAVTGKSGLFSFAGHDHAVMASQWTARLAFDPQDLAHSSAVVVIPVSALAIDSPEARQKAHLGSGPSPDDVKKIQAMMLGPEVLEASRYPAITFKAISARESAPDRLLVTGDLALHGRTRRITVPVHYLRESTGAYIFDGDFKIRQTDFGMKPESVAAGTVKVKDEVQIRFRISIISALQ